MGKTIGTYVDDFIYERNKSFGQVIDDILYTPGPVVKAVAVAAGGAFGLYAARWVFRKL